MRMTMQINTKTVVKMMKIKLLQTMARADFDNNKSSDDENDNAHEYEDSVADSENKIVMNLSKMKKFMNSMYSEESILKSCD